MLATEIIISSAGQGGVLGGPWGVITPVYPLDGACLAKDYEFVFSGMEVALVFWSDPTGLTELIIQSCVLGPVQLHPAPPPCLLSLCVHEPQNCH